MFFFLVDTNREKEGDKMLNLDKFSGYKFWKVNAYYIKELCLLVCLLVSERYRLHLSWKQLYGHLPRKR